ncbi:Leukotriene C4 synthase, partial [Chaetura pelagica]
AYFVLQVIYARRKHKIPPPETRGHPEFERIFRAHSGSGRAPRPLRTGLPPAGVAALCGLLYLYTRFKYFQGYSAAAQERLGPLYASARLLWLLLGLAVAGLLAHFLLPHSLAWGAVLPWPLQLLAAH